jgi:hypothetical protein
MLPASFRQCGPRPEPRDLGAEYLAYLTVAPSVSVRSAGKAFRTGCALPFWITPVTVGSSTEPAEKMPIRESGRLAKIFRARFSIGFREL